MLMQRRGFKITFLAGIAAYILFSALVGPLLAFAAINAVAGGIYVGFGRQIRLNPVINTFVAGFLYAVFNLILPQIIGVIVFRYPIHDLVKSAQNFVAETFKFLEWLAARFHASPAAIHQLQAWEKPVEQHWQWAWFGLWVFNGLTTMYLAVLVVQITLSRVPKYTLQRQRLTE